MQRSDIFDPDAPKKATNLSLNEDLVRAAKEQGLNVSAVAERALVDSLLEGARQAWREENAEAIRSYNESLKSRKLFSDGRRRF